MYTVRHSAEGETYGHIFLTPDEAEIVKYATNPSNWTDIDGDGYGGSFDIIDSAVEAIMYACDADNPQRACGNCVAAKDCPYAPYL